ncbi:hypothetical protein H8E77_36870 [bacterium]|nr:hypothetical protein [bacterium]
MMRVLEKSEARTCLPVQKADRFGSFPQQVEASTEKAHDNYGGRKNASIQS